ncbi:UDP-N-acetylglucosamine--undecaprenyl-phosphate N-acetylglucosaminephosphotransferase [Thorsellia kenyensis]|uniref:Undecaprenyl-phosphate alpha-N-acetylglucosaminyl 1-phosphate transferase n=1 Tax=Thorsellia kenyensis TaxID=1549888 RepID=A0ABV6CBU5_9GAMM
MLFELIVLFLFSLAFLFLARKVAKKIGLVDKPNFRKKHLGVIPLVGGISIYASLVYLFFVSEFFRQIPDIRIYLLLAGLLVLVGAIDDRFDISVKLRATVQAFVAVCMIYFAGLSLMTFGSLLGSFEVKLGFIGYLLTLFAVWGAINAFNMVDGIDGLLGGLSCVTFAALALVFSLAPGNPHYTLWALAMIVATIPYILLNLGLLGRKFKVFMGDAGSTLIGFTAIWMLLVASQPFANIEPAQCCQLKTFISPVTALWFIAIPLMDMIAIMYRRIKKGLSPFSADRQHIHHLMLRAGFSSRQAFVLITLSAALLAVIGIIGQLLISYMKMPEWIMLILFLFFFSLYGYCIKRAWKVARMIRRFKRRINKNKKIESH